MYLQRLIYAVNKGLIDFSIGWMSFFFFFFFFHGLSFWHSFLKNNFLGNESTWQQSRVQGFGGGGAGIMGLNLKVLSDL